MERNYSFEEKVIAMELFVYMKENNASLEEAYDAMMIPEERRSFSEDDLNNIYKDSSVICIS